MEYALGHSDGELERLERQGKFLSGLTRDLLVRAGIGPGMRVLDFGAGAGDVSLLASDLVGPGGEVVAVERSAEAAAHARTRTTRRNIRNIRIVQGDESSLPQAMGDTPFDAVVGRLVLVHQADPAACFLHLLRFVKPGGIVAFHEIEMHGKDRIYPDLPLLERTWHLIAETFRRGGMATDIHVRLSQAFDRAGISDRRIVREGPIEGPDSNAWDFISLLARSLLPAMIKRGVMAGDELGVDTLPERIRDEALRAQTYFTPINLIAAFGRTAAVT